MYEQQRHLQLLLLTEELGSGLMAVDRMWKMKTQFTEERERKREVSGTAIKALVRRSSKMLI